MVVRHKSLYHILDLDSTASAKDIKSAYYKLSILHHPDKNKGSAESVAKFRQIAEAYEILGNPEKKKKYDQEYRLEPQYSSYNAEQQAKSYSSRSTYYTSQSKYTGKTKDFNYDEHYRQHYENIKKQREMEYEYFRRRWEAEFYRKYPTADHYYRNRHKEHEEPSEHLWQKFRARRRAYYFLLSTWGILFFILTASEYRNPDRQNHTRSKTIYYETQQKKDSD